MCWNFLFYVHGGLTTGGLLCTTKTNTVVCLLSIFISSMTVHPYKHQTGRHIQKRRCFEFDFLLCLMRESPHPPRFTHEYGVAEPRWGRQASPLVSELLQTRFLVGGLEWILGGTTLPAFFTKLALLSLEGSHAKFIVFILQRMDKYFWRVCMRRREKWCLSFVLEHFFLLRFQ